MNSLVMKKYRFHRARGGGGGGGGAIFTSIHLAQLTENHAIVIQPVRVACRLNM